jgi:hypothetical protein
MPVQELPDYFDGIIEILTTYIEHKTDHFTLQTYGGDYINGPYVQALQEHDNILLIEAISNEFLVPELSEHGQQAMVFMGWRFFPERYLPNYAQFIDQSQLSPREIAIKMAQALHFAYGVDDTYTFEIAPPLAKTQSAIERSGTLNAKS